MNGLSYPASVFQISRAVTAWLALILMLSPIDAAEPFPDPPPNLKTYEWTLSPAKEPGYALEYKLLPALYECKPGNAATYYYRALLLEADLPKETDEEMERRQQWLEMPCDKLPVADVKKWLATRFAVLGELKTASRCETCNWESRFQDLRGLDVVMVRLHEFQQTRQFARILGLQAKLEIAEKKFNAALNTLQQIYRLAHDLNSVPSLIVNLIAIAEVSKANDILGEFIATEGAPNLYWAFRGLPDPILNMDSPIQFEGTFGTRMFPFLIDAETAQLPPQEWLRLLGTTDVNFNTYDIGSGSPQARIVRTTALVMRSYPIAKRELIASGYDKARVEQMPVGQVVAIYTRDCYRHVDHETAKWSLVPYAIGRIRLEATREKLQQEGYFRQGENDVPDRDPMLLNSELGYNIEGIVQANYRTRNMIAALTTIEAIRLHAAENGGQLPVSLSDIKIVPVPSNPSTGEPFLYRVVDHRAELMISPLRAGDSYSGRRFLFRMR
jgi:hypothetical protein